MKEIFILEVEARMAHLLSPVQLGELGRALREGLEGKELYYLEPSQKKAEPGNAALLGLFLSAKRTEGCSERTSKYYRSILDGYCGFCGALDIRLADADFIRSYLADYRERNGCGNITLDNIRRVLSSFYGWLESEERIVKSPVRRIHRIKVPQEKKEAFTEEDVEDLRRVCSMNKRDAAVLELLLSSGIRVGELVRLDRADIDLQCNSGKVLGKGNKEREIYFNVRTRRALREYLGTRCDENPALFVSRRGYRAKGGHVRMSINAVESMIRRAGGCASVGRAHPHRFRRTFATWALNKGMPIELVQAFLGHSKIDTTLRYAMVQQRNVRAAYEKYVG